jgi:hypothetical protein
MQPRTISTLRQLKDDGYEVTAHCGASVDCRHSAKLDLDLLIEKLGGDFVTVGDPNPLAARLRCEKCGGRSITLILSPPATPSPGAGYLSDAYR